MELKIWERGQKKYMDRIEYFNISSANHEEEMLKYYTNSLITKIKKSLNENRDEQELFDSILSIVKSINTLNTTKEGSKKRRHD
jgi:hypothetical protein